MSRILIGVGEFAAANQTGDFLKTMALGSCVATILLDPKTRTVGMCHVALPDSSISSDRARQRPGYFADTGIPGLLGAMAALGCNPRGKGFIVKLAGGAKVMDPNNTFNIGHRNVLAIKKVLWKHGMGAVAEDVEGSISRTVEVHVDSGRTIISSAGRPSWEL